MMYIDPTCYNSVVTLNTPQADDVFTMTNNANPASTQYGPTFDLSTSSLGCELSTTTYIWDDVNNVWIEYTSVNFDFFSTCSTCNGLSEGTVMVQKPVDRTPYKPFKDYLFKVVATDEIGLATPLSSEFTIQLRDECADCTLIAPAGSSDIASFSYMMDSGESQVTLLYEQSIASCSNTFVPEYYDSLSGTWIIMDPATLDYLTGIDSSAMTLTFNLVDTPAYQPEKAINFKLTLSLDDSIAVSTSLEDMFTVTFYDGCKDDQITWATGASTSTFELLVNTSGSGFQATYS